MKDLIIRQYLSSTWSMYVGIVTNSELLNLDKNVKKQLAIWKDYAIDTKEIPVEMIRSICSYVSHGLNDYYCNEQYWEGVVTCMYFGRIFCITPVGVFVKEDYLDQFIAIQTILRGEERG